MPKKESSKSSVIAATALDYRDEAYFVTPEFIYGGPFIEVKKPSPFLDTITPINVPLQGTFRRSFAYYSLKDRLPVLLTKIIDHLSRDGSKIRSACGASDADLKQFMQVVTKLKNDLVTNKEYEPFKLDTPDLKKWNEWIENLDDKKYFNNVWVFSECYVYRKLYEGCESIKGLQKFDYFEQQKNASVEDNMQTMCLVANKLVDMWNKSEKDKRKADFVTLLKVCLWANKCDLSLSLGEKVIIGGTADEKEKVKEEAPKPPAPPAAPAGKGKGKAAEPAKPLVVSSDPFQMIIDLKDKLLVDDTNKIADQVVTKAENMRKAIDGSAEETADAKKGASQPVPAPEGEATEEPPKIPCPTKMTVPHHVMFDIVCDNAGYELFADLCLASFLIEQGIVEKVRFHLKRMPWFVSDATPKDFDYLIKACMNATFRKEFPVEEKPAETTGDNAKPPEEPPQPLTSDNLRLVGEKFKSMVDDGSFLVLAEDYWTYPLVYRDMKKFDPLCYRSLQYAIAILLKGDLNYRKLLGDRNVNPYLGLEPCLQGFMPAPLLAVRTVKAELVCGLPKPKAGKLGLYEQLQQTDPNWMRTGQYGVIQFCPKGEPLKVSDRPCGEYGDTCRGLVCPHHERDM